jgi:hypothetical protein
MLPSKRGRAPESRELARRLHLLLDYVEAVRGDPYTFTEISEYLAQRNIPLSRSRWSYMLSGEQWKVRDLALIDALADLFDVDPRYLHGVGEVPDQIEAEMRLVLALLAPETLEVITNALMTLSRKEK